MQRAGVVSQLWWSPDLRDWRSEIEFVYRSRRAEGVHHRASLYRVDNLTRCTAKDACKIEGLAGAQSKEGLLDHARVTPRCAGRAATAANGMPRHPKRDPLRDSSGARRNVMAKVGRLSVRNRTVRSESHTRAMRYRIVRGLASADAP